ncbi:uncharacterized histidine-rich protein DDB_G0274557-like [Lucilia sericata]|uniref:uncharacterized histidine-rich protein DDB_G0274557-like n=1 Tax=Lucilia sericata TaxID=13632 RepID=UPI0018A8739E|nr:uncharacterized histidine-rich protein DDB_G0274557-like [Lucilia sericata]
MAQFVTHIQPTLLEASQGHVPHHHAHQVGLQHTSHLPHSGHNMPSPPTTHNHQHHQQHHHQQQQSSHHAHHQSPPSQLSSPPATGGFYSHYQQQQQQMLQHQQQHHHHHGQGKHTSTGGKHEHCPSGHQSSVIIT